MGSGSCPGDQIFLPGWVFECMLLLCIAREQRRFLECTWNSLFLFMVSLQPGVSESSGMKVPHKVAFLPLRGWGTRSSFCLSGGLYFLHIQWDAVQHRVSQPLDTDGSATHQLCNIHLMASLKVRYFTSSSTGAIHKNSARVLTLTASAQTGTIWPGNTT